MAAGFDTSPGVGHHPDYGPGEFVYAGHYALADGA